MTHLSSFYFPLFLNKLSPFNANCHWRDARPLSPSKSDASHSLVSEYRSAYLRLLHLLCFPDGRRPLTPLPGMLHPVDNPLLLSKFWGLITWNSRDRADNDKAEKKKHLHCGNRTRWGEEEKIALCHYNYRAKLCGTVQACEFHAYLTASTRVPNVLAMARERRSFVTPIQDNVGHVLDSGDDSNEDSRCNDGNIDHPLPPIDLFTYHELHLDVKGNWSTSSTTQLG